MKQLNLLKIKEELDKSEYCLDTYYPGLEINQVYLGQIDDLLEDSKWGDDNWKKEFNYLDIQLSTIKANIEMSPGLHTCIFAHRQREISIDNWVDFSWIESLEKGWDSYGSDPPSPGDIQKARELLERIKDTFMYEIPTLYPCSDTSIFVTYRKGKDGVEVDCFGEEQMGVHYCYILKLDGEDLQIEECSLETAERMVRRYINKVYE